MAAAQPPCEAGDLLANAAAHAVAVRAAQAIWSPDGEPLVRASAAVGDVVGAELNLDSDRAGAGIRS